MKSFYMLQDDEGEIFCDEECFWHERQEAAKLAEQMNKEVGVERWMVIHVIPADTNRISFIENRTTRSYTGLSFDTPIKGKFRTFWHHHIGPTGESLRHAIDLAIETADED
jgi:hypothetical protein